MQTQVLKPILQVLLLDVKSAQEFELLLPHTNERHVVKVISKQYNYRNGQLLTVEDKLPILVNFKPSNLHAEFSCKRYFVSKLIEKIKLYLIRKYHFYFSIKTVRELRLNIIREIDVFDSNQSTFTINAELVVEYFKQATSTSFTETFTFSSCSLLGDIVLEKCTTLPPDIWNRLKDFVAVPRGIIYNFDNNLITFNFKNKLFKFDTETKDLSW